MQIATISDSRDPLIAKHDALGDEGPSSRSSPLSMCCEAVVHHAVYWLMLSTLYAYAKLFVVFMAQHSNTSTRWSRAQSAALPSFIAVLVCLALVSLGIVASLIALVEITRRWATNRGSPRVFQCYALSRYCAVTCALVSGLLGLCGCVLLATSQADVFQGRNPTTVMQFHVTMVGWSGLSCYLWVTFHGVLRASDNERNDSEI